MSSLVIGPANPQDAEGLAAIAGRNPAAPQWTASDFQRMLPHGLPAGPLLRIALVAALNAEPVGFAVATVLVSVSPAEAELESIAVDPAHQGSGIGRALLLEVTGWALAHGAETLRLEVRAGNERALRFYLRHGFHQTGSRAGYYSAPADDAVLLELQLLPAPGARAPALA